MIGSPDQPIAQGEVFEVQIGKARHRVVVVSNDVHNTVFVPWVVPIRHGRREAWPYAVPLVDADPFGGTADVSRLLTRLRVTGQPLGMITGATMQRLREAIAAVIAG